MKTPTGYTVEQGCEPVTVTLERQDAWFAAWSLQSHSTAPDAQRIAALIRDQAR